MQGLQSRGLRGVDGGDLLVGEACDVQHDDAALAGHAHKGVLLAGFVGGVHGVLGGIGLGLAVLVHLIGHEDLGRHAHGTRGVHREGRAQSEGRCIRCILGNLVAHEVGQVADTIARARAGHSRARRRGGELRRSVITLVDEGVGAGSAALQVAVDGLRGLGLVAGLPSDRCSGSEGMDFVSIYYGYGRTFRYAAHKAHLEGRQFGACVQLAAVGVVAQHQATGNALLQVASSQLHIGAVVLLPQRPTGRYLVGEQGRAHGALGRRRVGSGLSGGLLGGSQACRGALGAGGGARCLVGQGTAQLPFLLRGGSGQIALVVGIQVGHVQGQHEAVAGLRAGQVAALQQRSQIAQLKGGLRTTALHEQALGRAVGHARRHQVGSHAAGKVGHVLLLHALGGRGDLG